MKEISKILEGVKMKKIKLVIWDLDNTLWDGTVFYKDKEAVTIKAGTKATLKELSKRDIKISICSKNYFEDAEKVLEKFEILNYFEYPQIGWDQKSDSIKKILKHFNIEASEAIFVDDDSFQRAEVISQIPELNVIELTDPLDLLNYKGIIPDNATDIDKNRVIILKQQRDREEAENGRTVDYKDFLKSCNIEMSIRKNDEKDWPRITQLLNRTNELNATVNRYTMEKLKESQKINNDKIYIASIKDKFGEYGLIAETIIDTRLGGIWFVRDITVSCRTMGRGVGGALLTFILNKAKEKKISKVMGVVNKTESNWRMHPLFEKRNFKKIWEQDNISTYEFDVNNEIIPNYPEYLKITFNGDK